MLYCLNHGRKSNEEILGGKKKDTTYKLLESGQIVRDIIICSLDATLFLQHLILATLGCTVLCYMSLQTDSSSAITFMILLQCYIYVLYIFFFFFNLSVYNSGVDPGAAILTKTCISYFLVLLIVL